MLHSSAWRESDDGLSSQPFSPDLAASLVAILTIQFRMRGVRLRPSWVAAVVVLLSACGTANRAEASCGDWLASHDTPPGQVVNLDHRPLAPVPCHGPNCQARQHLPVVPPAPSRQFDGPERWCWLIEELAARPTLSCLLPAEADFFPVCGFAPRLERPPRL
jgi:hypothetical protein